MADAVERLKAALADRYRLERELGAGGMATVYLAEDLRHQRPVAVKVLRPELSATLGADRFLREIQLTARLQHPHILTLIDSGAAAGALYFVMPYVAGESLRTRLHRTGPLPLAEAVQVVAGVAAALDYAHRQGVVHRDVKPENILLHEGETMVADFGIALALKGSSTDRLTETGMSLGTPAYMSPEQVTGTRDLDGRSDQYSLACVLYELVSGAPPFAAPTAQGVAVKHVTELAPALRTPQGTVPVAMVQAVARALAKDPTDRFATVGEFAAALQVAHAAPAAAEESIVVLPFANLSPDPDNAFFADGLTEELIADLSKVRRLKVIARNSAMRLKGTSKDARALGQELSVRYVLGGSVRRAGENLRVTAQLSDTRDDRQVWAEKYSGTLDDVFELQEQLSRQIVAALAMTLSPDERSALAERPIKRPLAYELYLKGRQELFKTTKTGIERGLGFLRQAEAVEGPNARIVLSMATGYVYLRDFGYETSLDIPSLEDQCLARLRVLAPAGAEVEYVSALVDQRHDRWLSGTQRLGRALARAPGDADVLHLLAFRLASYFGQPTRTLGAVQHLREVDPLWPLTHHLAGVTEWASGRYAEALAAFDAGLQLEPDNWDLRGWRGLVLAYCASPERAAAEFRELAARAREGSAGLADWCLLVASGVLGDRHGVGAATTPALRVFLDRVQPLWMLFVAQACALAGLKTEAMDWMEKLFARGFANYPLVAEDPLLANLRGFPRFEAFLPGAKAAWEQAARQLQKLPSL